jgi:hypothetical protein
MAQDSVVTFPVARPALPLATSRIRLTPAGTEPHQSPLSVTLDELISYSQGANCTRLSLTGRRVLEVKETTDQIDRLVRAAASRSTFIQEEHDVLDQFRPKDGESGLAA